MVCVASTKSSKELILCFIVGYSKKSHYTFPTDRRSIWRSMGKEPNQLGTFQPETCGYEVSSVQKGIFNIASFSMIRTIGGLGLLVPFTTFSSQLLGYVIKPNIEVHGENFGMPLP